MIRKLSVLTSPALMLMLSASAFAQEHAAGAGHEGHEVVGAIPSVQQGLYTGITALVVFLIVLVVLTVKVWPTISKALDDRASKIRNSIESAEQAQKDARAALEQYEKSLAQARAEAQKMLDDTKTQQTALASEMRARNDADISAMREKAKREIDQAKRAAVAEIHEHATELAMNIAAKILQREIGPQDQQRLVRESLAEIPGAGRN